MQALIIPTNRCNLRCKHCLRNQYEGEDLHLDDLEAFLTGFEDNLLGNRFCLTGGEPTLHRKFPEILKILEKFGFTGSVVSNCQNENSIREIINNQKTVTHVLVSLEGPNARINDKIRGKGTFKKALEAIKIIKKTGIKVYVRTTLNALNIHLVKEMLQFSKKHDIDLLNFATIEPCENTKKNNIAITWKMISAAVSQFREACLNDPSLKTVFHQRNTIVDLYPEWPHYLCYPIGSKHGQITLKPDGDVSFCCDLVDFGFNSSDYKDKNDHKLNHILGNIRKNSFDEILKNRKKLTAALIKRRREDAFNDRLSGNRSVICDNCKFYFYKED
jgi:MoaA/NifB/PqqE/SkfB family radical SAM enzyme